MNPVIAEKIRNPEPTINVIIPIYSNYVKEYAFALRFFLAGINNSV